jgi:hypothetical protein
MTFGRRRLGAAAAHFTEEHLFRLPLEQAFAKVVLPLHLNWSDSSTEYNSAERRDRRLVYQRVLVEGLQDDAP